MLCSKLSVVQAVFLAGLVGLLVNYQPAYSNATKLNPNGKSACPPDSIQHLQRDIKSISESGSGEWWNVLQKASKCTESPAFGEIRSSVDEFAIRFISKDSRNVKKVLTLASSDEGLFKFLDFHLGNITRLSALQDIDRSLQDVCKGVEIPRLGSKKKISKTNLVCIRLRHSVQRSLNQTAH